MKKYLSDYDKGTANGVVPLNVNKKIDAKYIPDYTEGNIVANDTISDLSSIQTWSSEQTYNYEDYGLALNDTINGVATGFKAPRGLFNWLFVDDIVFTRDAKEVDSGIKNEIGFYTWNGVESKSAVKDSSGKITTAGYNNVTGAERVASITSDGCLVLKSSTPNSSKYFKITVYDNGSLNTSEFNFNN
jgi:hypothetical protein